MSFPKYPEYKDSGVAWLGAVPRHWEVKRARDLGVFSSSGIDKKSVEGEQPVQMFNYLDVYKSEDKTLRYSPELMWTTAPAEKVKEHSVIAGDILLTPSSETEDDIGHAARVTEIQPNVVYSYHLIRFRKSDAADSAFLTYCFNAPSIRSYFESVCTGTTRMVLVREDFKSAPFSLPPLSEQVAIAAFLDRETGKIDALIAEQRRLIDLLKEKRQAVISHAVTRGLNPGAPLRPSGIPWLGDVPAHWRATPVKFVARVGNGSTPSREVPEYWTENGFPWLNSSMVNLASVTEAEEFVTERALKECHLPIISPPAVLVGITGQGRTRGMATMLQIEATINQHVAFVKPITQELDVRFLLSIFEMAYLKLRRDSEETGATKGAITCEQIGNLRIPLPPLAEQHAIVAFLDAETARLDALMASAGRAIELLQERRTALISAAVTGRIDVRAATAA